MDINEFYKVNNLVGIKHRPAFLNLYKMFKSINSNSEKNDRITAPDLIANCWLEYMNPEDKTKALEFIVLLEDFVGSGIQCKDTLQWAINAFNKPILFIPLILCPNGADALNKLQNESNGHLTVSSIMTLNRSDLLGPQNGDKRAWPISQSIEKLAKKCKTKHLIPKREPFGYKKTGCSIATYTNTPNNTLPLVHHKPSNSNWQPLFPRIDRG